MKNAGHKVSGKFEIVYDLALAMLISFFIVVGLLVYFDIY